MKINKKLSYMCHVLAGFVLSLTGVAQEGSAAVPVQPDGDAGNVGNVVQPGPYARKNHEVAFETRGRVKTKSAIGTHPDGRVYGFITRQEQLAQNGRTKQIKKNKSLLYMATPRRRNLQDRGRMLESRPARGVKSRLVDWKPATRKSPSIVDKPAQGKGKSIIGAPRRGVSGKSRSILEQPGRGKRLESRPARGVKSRLVDLKPATRKSPSIVDEPAQGKGKSIIGAPRRGVSGKSRSILEQPGSGKRLESQPGKSRGFAPQGKLDGDGFLFTPEQKEQLIFGSRDYLWLLNNEGLLERHLPDGVRVVIGQRGMVDVFDSENRLAGRFHSPAAEKMDRALRITQDMKDMIQALPEQGNGHTV